MQVHPRKLDGTWNRVETRKLYMWIGIAVIVVAILVAIAIVSYHQTAGHSIISQICYHNGAHLCGSPQK